MKLLKQAFCIFLVAVMLLSGTGVGDLCSMRAEAYADNTPSSGTTDVGEAGELMTLGEWVYYVEDGEATVAGYLNTAETALTVPHKLGGYPVTGIGQAAFQPNTALSSIEIPTNVTRIAKDAFNGLSVTISAYHGAYALIYADEMNLASNTLSNTPGVTFAEGVLDLTGAAPKSYYGLSESGAAFNAKQATYLAVGEILYFPADASYPTGLAKKVEEIKENGSEYLVTFSDPDWGDCFENISGTDDVYLDWENAIFPEGVEAEVLGASTSTDTSVKLNIGDIGTLVFKLGKTSVSYDWGWKRHGLVKLPNLNSAVVNFPISTDVSVHFKAEDKSATTRIGKRITFVKGVSVPAISVLGTINGYIKLDIVGEVDGSVTFAETEYTDVTFTYTNGRLTKNVKNQSTNQSLEIKATAKIGPQLSIYFVMGWGGFSIRFLETDFGLFLQLEGSAKFTRITEIPSGTDVITCIDISLKLVFECEVKIGAIKLAYYDINAYASLKFTWESPDLFEGHFDNGKLRSSCTLKDRKVEIDNGSSCILTTADVNKRIDAPNTPSKKGYTFEGWYVNTRKLIGTGGDIPDYEFNFATDFMPYCGADGTFYIYAKFKEIIPTGVSITKPSTQTITLDSKSKTVQLNAKVTPANAANTGLTWTSSNSKIATVDSYGKVTFKEPGTVTITCTCKADTSVKASLIFTVIQRVTGLKVTAGDSYVEKNASTTVSAAVSPSDASDKSVTWSSSNTSAATVDANGKVTVGNVSEKTTVTITAKAADGSKVTGSTTINIIAHPVSGITLNKTSVTDYTSNTSGVQLSATVAPSNADYPAVTWKSSNESVAKVSSTGLVTYVGPGTATITCTSNSKPSVSASCSFTVKQYVTRISVDADPYFIVIGNSVNLTATVKPSNATDKSVTWSSSDTSIATVDANGNVTAKAEGDFKITATAKDGSGVSGSYAMRAVTTMPILVSGVALNQTTATIYTDDTNGLQLKQTVSPSNADYPAVRWSSSNESVAVVDSNGLVTPVCAGTAVITCQSISNKNATATCTVTVKQHVTSITISGENEIELGQSTALTATALPENASDKSVTWSISKINGTPSATISSSGVLKAVTDENVVVTATAKDGSGVVATYDVRCGHPIPVYPTEITLEPSSVEIYANQTDGVQLTATVEPSNADDPTVSWSSNNDLVATVDSTGHVTPHAAGTAIITCKSNMVSGVWCECTVTVKQYVEQIYVTGDAASLIPGETAQLTADVAPLDATDKSVVWSSSNEAVATIDENGKVTAVSAGDVIFTATAHDGSGAYGTYSFKVEKELQLTVSMINDTVYTQGTEKCELAYVGLTEASMLRMAKAGNELSWSMVKKSGSGDTELTTIDAIDETDEATYQTSIAQLYGSDYPDAGTEVYTVICKTGEFEESVDISVNVDGSTYASGVQLKDTNLSANTFNISIGENALIPSTPYSVDENPVPSGMSLSIDGDSWYRQDATETTVETGTNVSFAESDNYTAKVTYSKGNLAYPVEATFNVADENGLVHLRVDSLELSDYYISMVEGNSQELTVTVGPDDAYDKSVTWASEDPEIAEISEDGMITGLQPGIAAITCTANDRSGKMAICTLRVESFLQMDEEKLEYTVYTGGKDHADLGIVNLSFDSANRLADAGLNVSWQLEKVSGSSTELGLGEYASAAEKGVSVTGNLIKLLRMNGAGTDEYLLTCSAGEYSAQCTVCIHVVDSALPEAITLSTDSYTGTINEYLTIDTSYTVQPSGSKLPDDVSMTITGGNAFWNALSPFYDFGNAEQLIFEKAGTYKANVVFSGSNYSYSCPVTLTIADENGDVPANITDLALNEDMLYLFAGESKDLTLSVEPASATFSSVSWSSTDTSIATVSADGKVTAIGNGYAVISASVPESDEQATCMVFVEDCLTLRDNELERTVFVDGTTRMILDTIQLTECSSARQTETPEWTLERVSGISLTLKAEPTQTVNADGMTVYGCNLQLYSVSKEGDTVYNLTCSAGDEKVTATITVHAVNRDRVLPASISMAETVFTADIGELIAVKPEITTYPENTKLPDGIRVSCEGDRQYLAALNAEDTYVSQSLSTFSFNKAGTFSAYFIYSYSNMQYAIPVTFRIKDADGNVPVLSSKLTLNHRSLYLTKGDEADLAPVFTPADATNQVVTWTSSNPGIVSVDENGHVTALANGTAKITCTPADTEVSAVTCGVTVENELTVQAGTTTRTLYVQGTQENIVSTTTLSTGTFERFQTANITPVWTFTADSVTHSELRAVVSEDSRKITVYSDKLLSGGTDTFTITCTEGDSSWSKTYTLNVVDLGSTAPSSVSIAAPELNLAVGETTVVDFTPILSPSGASMPSDMTDSGIMGAGGFYDAIDQSVYETNDNLVTVAFTKPGRYLMMRCFTRGNLMYSMSCTITVGDQAEFGSLLYATEKEYTVYSGGTSGVISTIGVKDTMVAELWKNQISWKAERISGNSLTVGLKDNGTSVDVFAANVQNNGTDVWRITCTIGDATDYVDLTLTADTPRSALPESISLANVHLKGTIGSIISIPLGVNCTPSGSALPDQGDEFWTLNFDAAGEANSSYEIENGLLQVVFAESGYYTGTLKYKSGNVSYSVDVYFVISDEEEEVKNPNLNMYVLNAFDTVYPEGKTNVAIAQVAIAESLSTYSTGAAVAYMNENAGSWQVNVNGIAAALKLEQVSANVYNVVLTGMPETGNIAYTVSCTDNGKTYSATQTLHVAAADETRPDGSLAHTTYKTKVGEVLTIDNGMYARADQSNLQSVSTLDETPILSAVGYEVTDNQNSWEMTFYEPGTYCTTVTSQVSNLTVETPIVIVVENTDPALTVLVLPKALTEIKAEAFTEASMNVVDLRNTEITKIGAGAFRSCHELTAVYLPSTSIEIADDAFSGCGEITFYCAAGSSGAEWAAAHGYTVVNP